MSEQGIQRQWKQTSSVFGHPPVGINGMHTPQPSQATLYRVAYAFEQSGDWHARSA